MSRMMGLELQCERRDVIGNNKWQIIIILSVCGLISRLFSILYVIVIYMSLGLEEVFNFLTFYLWLGFSWNFLLLFVIFLLFY